MPVDPAVGMLRTATNKLAAAEKLIPQMRVVGDDADILAVNKPIQTEFQSLVAPSYILSENSISGAAGDVARAYASSDVLPSAKGLHLADDLSWISRNVRQVHPYSRGAGEMADKLDSLLRDLSRMRTSLDREADDLARA